MSKKVIALIFLGLLLSCSGGQVIEKNLKTFPPKSKPLWKDNGGVKPYVSDEGHVCMSREHFQVWVDTDIYNRGQLKMCNDQSTIYNSD